MVLRNGFENGFGSKTGAAPSRAAANSMRGGRDNGKRFQTKFARDKPAAPAAEQRDRKRSAAPTADAGRGDLIFWGLRRPRKRCFRFLTRFARSKIPRAGEKTRRLPAPRQTVPVSFFSPRCPQGQRPGRKQVYILQRRFNPVPPRCPARRRRGA